MDVEAKGEGEVLWGWRRKEVIRKTVSTNPLV
jgi:hypothetical protein